MTDFFHRTTVQAFAEDRAMIEAQQRVINMEPASSSVSVRGDAGGLQARRLVGPQIERERAGPPVEA